MYFDDVEIKTPPESTAIFEMNWQLEILMLKQELRNKTPPSLCDEHDENVEDDITTVDVKFKS